MAYLPQVSGKEVQKALVRVGYYPVSQKGSHMKLRRENPRKTLIIPNHKTLKKGTLRGIIADAGLSTEEFMQLLQKRY